MTDLRNNLFYYATKELSQDAFICWLCSHALDEVESSDEALKNCAIDLIASFFDNEIPDKDSLKLIGVEKQVSNIDVLLSVFYAGKKYKIIVEDKTHTSEHDNQLERYKETLIKSGCSDELIGIYYKMGFQSDYTNVIKAGYKIIDRAAVLSVLKKYIDKTSNEIFLNYFQFWNEFDNVTYSFSQRKPSEWDWRQIYGFYEEIQTKLTSTPYDFWVGYDYVANKSGGFYGLWYGSDSDKIETTDLKSAVYLQLEATWNGNNYDYRICLKSENQSETSNSIFDSFKRNIINKLSLYGFQKPKRVGSGQHVTVGILNPSSDSYNALKEAILESLEQYKRILANRNELLSGI